MEMMPQPIIIEKTLYNKYKNGLCLFDSSFRSYFMIL